MTLKQNNHEQEKQSFLLQEDKESLLKNDSLNKELSREKTLTQKGASENFTASSPENSSQTSSKDKSHQEEKNGKDEQLKHLDSVENMLQEEVSQDESSDKSSQEESSQEESSPKEKRASIFSKVIKSFKENTYGYGGTEEEHLDKIKKEFLEREKEQAQSAVDLQIPPIPQQVSSIKSPNDDLLLSPEDSRTENNLRNLEEANKLYREKLASQQENKVAKSDSSADAKLSLAISSDEEESKEGISGEERENQGREEKAREAKETDTKDGKALTNTSSAKKEELLSSADNLLADYQEEKTSSSLESSTSKESTSKEKTSSASPKNKTEPEFILLTPADKRAGKTVASLEAELREEAKITKPQTVGEASTQPQTNSEQSPSSQAKEPCKDSVLQTEKAEHYSEEKIKATYLASSQEPSKLEEEHFPNQDLKERVEAKKEPHPYAPHHPSSKHLSAQEKAAIKETHTCENEQAKSKATLLAGAQAAAKVEASATKLDMPLDSRSPDAKKALDEQLSRIKAASEIKTAPDYDALTDYQKELQSRLPAKWLLVSVLILLSIIPGLENTSFSPSIGQVQAQFGADVVALQAFYLSGMAFGQLLLGPLIDRIGRKPVVIICALAGICINITMTMSTEGWHLYASRISQGFAFGGLGICPTIILKDIFSTRQYVVYNSWLVLFFLYAPALGPLWGGVVVVNLGWRWIFYILTMILIVVLAIFILAIPETVKQKTLGRMHPLKALKSYFVILKNGRARYLIALNAGYAICIFSLPILVPNLLINTYGVHPDHIGFYFLVPLVSTLIANRLNVRYIKKGYSPRVVWITASLFQGCFSIVNFVVSYYFLGPIGIIFSFTANLFFNGFQLGNLQSLYLQMFPEMTATANSLMAFIRFFLPSVIVYGVSQLPKKEGLTLLHFDGFVVITCTIATIIYAIIYKPYVSKRIDLINKIAKIDQKREAKESKHKSST